MWHFVTTCEDGILNVFSVDPDSTKDPAAFKALIRDIFVTREEAARKKKSGCNELPSNFLLYVEEFLKGSYPSENEDLAEWVDSGVENLKNADVAFPSQWSKEDWGTWTFHKDQIPLETTGKHFYYHTWW